MRARPGGVGVAEVSPAEERDLAAGTLAEVRYRFDVPLLCTTRATVAEAEDVVRGSVGRPGAAADPADRWTADEPR